MMERCPGASTVRTSSCLADVAPDPFVPYRRDREARSMPLEARSGRALWRDAHAIIAGTLESSLRSTPNGVLGWLSEIARS